MTICVLLIFRIDRLPAIFLCSSAASPGGGSGSPTATGCTKLATAGCPVVGREILATGSPNDWLDQTMSYQLIQTTSFAMHPRLVDYITVALVWMYCSCLLLATDCDVTADFINADPALALLFTTAECDDITADVIIADSASA
ncbi:hypothetical protein F511_42143 [Dorcoceras hygrometricum]|uniref:Uncharacterized protein n=1 Tax=Dorcoceras hygrometricum TaxID=472368 RepID=A0A2Z7C0K6_9LAMI|nr:hypothetical protein F511_42143 [Dorcoceras hygrometricum]